MNRNDALTVRFMSRLVTTREGRAHVLNQAADAESNGEGGVFDHLLAYADDPAIAGLIRRHQADEVRHAELFRACLARTGVQPSPVPAELKLIDRLDRALGARFDKPIEGRRGVMEAYLVLQVVEERAVTQFGIFEPLFRAVDPETADVLLEIGGDEARHLKYCHAIARRYAPDEATLASELHRFRALEAVAYAENSRANLDYVLSRGLLQASPLETVLWRGLSLVGGLVRREQRTPFWGQEPGARKDRRGAHELAEAA